MNDLFFRVLELGIQAGFLILAVIILRMTLRRAPRWMICLLWGVVALRLLCPLQIESSVSLQPTWTRNMQGILANLDERYSAKVEKEAAKIEEHSGWMERAGSETESPSDRTEKVTSEAESSSGWTGKAVLEMENDANRSNREELPYGNQNQTVAGWVRANWELALWILGICLMLSHAVVCLLPLRWSLRFAVRKYDANLETNFYESNMIVDPFILGVIRPRIYLPVGLEESAREHILRHELAHISRGDYVWKPLGFLLLAIYWYFPLCWIAYSLFCKDMELACDEKVIQRMNREGRAEYCQVLLQMCAKRRGILASPVAFAEVGAGYRIRAILDYRMPEFKNLILSFLIGMAVCICLLTSPEGSVSNEKGIDGIIDFFTDLEGNKRKTMDLTEVFPSERITESGAGKETTNGMTELGKAISGLDISDRAEELGTESLWESLEVHHFLDYDALFLEVPINANSSSGYYCSCLHDNAIYFYDERNGKNAIWRRGLADGKEEVYLTLERKESGLSAMGFTREGNLMVIVRPDGGKEAGSKGPLANEGQVTDGSGLQKLDGNMTDGSMLREYDGYGEKVLEMPLKGATEDCKFFDVTQDAQGRIYLRMFDPDAPRNTLVERLEDGSLLETETPNIQYVNGIGSTEEGILLCDPRALYLFDGTQAKALLQWTEVGIIAYEVVSVCKIKDEIQILTMDQNGQNAEMILLRERR